MLRIMNEPVAISPSISNRIRAACTLIASICLWSAQSAIKSKESSYGRADCSPATGSYSAVAD